MEEIGNRRAKTLNGMTKIIIRGPEENFTSWLKKYGQRRKIIKKIIVY